MATTAMRAAERTERETAMAMSFREMGLEEEGESVRMREEMLAGKVGTEVVAEGGGGGVVMVGKKVLGCLVLEGGVWEENGYLGCGEGEGERASICGKKGSW